MSQWVQIGSGQPSVRLFAFDNTGAPVTTWTNATSGLTIQYERPGAAPVSITLAAQTAAGAWTSGGFCHLGGGIYRLDLPTAAVATGVRAITVFASVTPANTFVQPVGVLLFADDIAAQAATPTSIATAVAAPSAATIAAAVRDEMLSVRWGVQTQPSGGSTQTLAIADQPSGTSLGVVRRFWSGPNSTGTLVGQTELTPS